MARVKSYEVDNERFYQIPKSLFGNPNYKGLLPEAKLVYAFLRDRMELSRKNGWVNEQDDIYFLFARKNIAELLEMSLPSITKCFKQLIEYKLIEEVRQGLGKPNLIFICHIELSKETSQKQKSFASGNKQSLHQDTKDICTNDTDVIDTDLLNKEKEEGIFSDEKHSPYSPYPTIPSIEVMNIRNYFSSMYYKKYLEGYHRHKKEQNEYINERLQEIIDEYGEETTEAFIDNYFKYKFNHNLIHFVEPGIIENRMYEVAY